MNNKKIPLTSQTQKLFIVIRKNKSYSLDSIKNFCEQYFDWYAFIEHKEDVEPITGLVEGCHYHIVCHVREKGVAKSTHLNNIQNWFKMTNQDGIEIDQTANKVLAIQYLIHKNNPEKTQHDYKEIVTNIPKDEFNNIIASDSGEIINFDMIYTLCISNRSILPVIKSIGITQYRLYRNVIWDIWNEVKSAKKKADIEKALTSGTAVQLD